MLASSPLRLFSQFRPLAAHTPLTLSFAHWYHALLQISNTMFSQYLFILLSCAGYAYSKTALAHFMVQSSYAYNLQQWKTDMASAKQMNLDGFALNWTPPDCQQPYLRWMVSFFSSITTASQLTVHPGDTDRHGLSSCRTKRVSPDPFFRHELF